VNFDCAHCGIHFIRPYRMNITRASRRQFCSKECNGKYCSDKARERFSDRFWARVKPANERGCREWSGRKHIRNGYGVIDLDGRPQLAHRIAYTLATGRDPGDLSICHTCDNPPCCEPSHLWAGTHQENMDDMAQKGRANAPVFIGEKHPRAKLSEEEIRDIRGSLLSDKILASDYGVTTENIRRIKTRKSWRHI
jgi:hypothetical protein